MLVFWEKGYDAASVSDLTEAMGINRPSLYASFGSKEKLFQKTLRLYSSKNAQLVSECLSFPQARAGIDRLLREAVLRFTDPQYPSGCFGNQITLGCSSISLSMKRTLEQMRTDFEHALRKRVERAASEGELSTNVVPSVLASYITLVFFGLGLQAKAGTSREDLLRVVDIAMDGWPVR